MKTKKKKTDWRALLKSYMKHVITSEGISFIHSGYLVCELSPEENELLQIIEQEIKDGQ